ncbi:MAG: hypothetical protein O7157_00285 [Wolbachia endosymbiont of Tetragnatha montana]|nr:hypothetical protein [Wolbachia endosymbiont of Tetragnatha montana]
MTKIINWVIIKLLLIGGVKTVLASNNSLLLKDSQKTKGAIWKPLIAVLSLSIFSFISGQYLPYVIAAISGSGPIAAVPLAIFTVSTVVALVLATYLIKLAVSRADNKKEVSPDGKKSGYIASQEPQKFVCENCTNLENKPIGEELIKQDSGSQTEVEDKSNVSTPTPPTVTFGTQPSASAPPPPPPPPMPTHKQLNQAGVAAQKNSANTTGEKPSVDTTQKEAPPTKKFTPPEGGKQPDDLRNQLREKLKTLREAASGKQKGDVESTNLQERLLEKISDRIPPPRSRSDSVSSNSSEESEQDWSDDEDQKSIGQAFSNPQSFHKERSESPDSDYGSDDNVKSEPTPPSHPVPKGEKPPIPPKPAGLQTKPEAPPASQVNEMQDPSALSIKERIALFGQK